MNRSSYKREAITHLWKNNYYYHATLGMFVIVKLGTKTKWDNRNYTMPL
jgi:hypothetical protein